MNRSFHAFAVLLVSLAGGMIAASWSSRLSSRAPVVVVKGNTLSRNSVHCSCNPESLMRYEEGCARDKTTGALYGCGLGLGENGARRSTVISEAANSAILSLVQGSVLLRNEIVGLPWQKLATGSEWLEKEIAAAVGRPKVEAEVQVPADRQEEEYAAAELAAAGIEAGSQSSDWLNISSHVGSLKQAISAKAIHRATWDAAELSKSLSRFADRQFRLWLVENGLHRQWDESEEVVMYGERIASALMKFEDEDFDRWFESFPPPVTQPNRLINPIEPKDDPEQSRRMILATAKVLDTLSSLLHQTAENLARQAEQDVAELNKLKSGIEERR